MAIYRTDYEIPRAGLDYSFCALHPDITIWTLRLIPLPTPPSDAPTDARMCHEWTAHTVTTST